MAAYDDLNEDLHPAIAEDPSTELDAPNDLAPTAKQAFVVLEKPPETKPDLSLLLNGEIVRALGRTMQRMEEIANHCAHNLLNVPQTEATFRMHSRSTIDATRAMQECVRLLQAIKYRTATDDVVEYQINKDNGVDGLGRPLPDFLKEPRYPSQVDVPEQEDENDDEGNRDVESADYEAWQKSFDHDDPS
ncbi:MAG: hypothetical protein AAGL97_02720 [Pseudomonadota bacterium]